MKSVWTETGSGTLGPCTHICQQSPWCCPSTSAQSLGKSEPKPLPVLCCRGEWDCTAHSRRSGGLLNQSEQLQGALWLVQLCWGICYHWQKYLKFKDKLHEQKNTIPLSSNSLQGIVFLPLWLLAWTFILFFLQNKFSDFKTRSLNKTRSAIRGNSVNHQLFLNPKAHLSKKTKRQYSKGKKFPSDYCPTLSL